MNAPKPYQGKEKFIFISYSHRDTEKVFPIITKLTENGYRVWYDQGIDPGTEWDENIATHIDTCGYFIAFMSKNYLGSSNCKDELNYARDLEKDRLIVYLEEVTLPAGMAMRINRIQSIFKYTYPSEEGFYEKLFTTNNIDVCLETKAEKSETVTPPAPEKADPVPSVSEPIISEETNEDPTPSIPNIPNIPSIPNIPKISDLTEAITNQKKKKKWLVPVLIAVAVIVILGIIIGASLHDADYDPYYDDYDDYDDDYVYEDDGTTEHGEQMQSSFQLVHDDGTISKFTLYYEDDVVYKFVNSTLFTLDKETAKEEAELYIEAFDSQFEEAMSLSFCDIDYKTGDTYFHIAITCSELDNVSNLEALVDCGIIETYTPGELLSFEVLKERLEADGFQVVFDS